MDTNLFFTKLKELYKQDSIQDYVDYIIHHIDTKLHEGEFIYLDKLLVSWDVKEHSIEATLSALTATLFAIDKLSNRHKVYDEVKQRLLDEGEDADFVLVGLDKTPDINFF